MRDENDRFPFGHNCAVRERNADGQPVGRCWFHVGSDDVCSRHGDVSTVMLRYRETGELSDENDRR